MADNQPQEPLGKRLRDFITPALEDTRAKDVQSEYVSGVFETISRQMVDMFESEFTDYFNFVTRNTKARPETKNPMIVNSLIAITDQRKGEADFSPIKRLHLPISTAFTDFSATEIKEMPGWIKLHEVARVDFLQLGIAGDEERVGMLPVSLHGIHEGHLLGGGREFLGMREGPKLRAVELNIVPHREAG